ncbi:hypothetical protein AKJ37_05135 [candidate division MSBL1 archaeon SCGC-AAA259I09]|uniref:Methyltransferase FkbM domain-containing protein n=1 Tax=candidate division MSBL1 archaeon SCGC-AAA259I09 TaxID=1698267 RepID=A0A133UQM5_9EURY|nr:hypothetical protein AKJ37_05135 [candidate division MSBL1 archaeon SCGC-AAA259I09]
MKLDVQGAELKVLKGAEEVLKDTELVLLEVQFFKFLEGCPEFYDIVDYMKKRGFVMYDIFGGYKRPLDGALAATNLVFVKEKGQFRKYHYYASPKQREKSISEK